MFYHKPVRLTLTLIKMIDHIVSQKTNYEGYIYNHIAPYNFMIIQFKKKRNNYKSNKVVYGIIIVYFATISKFLIIINGLKK